MYSLLQKVDWHYVWYFAFSWVCYGTYRIARTVLLEGQTYSMYPMIMYLKILIPDYWCMTVHCINTMVYHMADAVRKRYVIIMSTSILYSDYQYLIQYCMCVLFSQACLLDGGHNSWFQLCVYYKWGPRRDREPVWASWAPSIKNFFICFGTFALLSFHWTTVLSNK